VQRRDAGGQCGSSPPGTAPRTGVPTTHPSLPPEGGRRAAYTPRRLADRILEDRSALEGERLQVTVLFADVAGCTSVAEQFHGKLVTPRLRRSFLGAEPARGVCQAAGRCAPDP